MGKPLTYRHNCIVVDRVKLSEQDLILTLLAEDGSQIRAVGKGARKSGSRLSARCDYFCITDFLFRRGKGSLDYISEANLVEIYPNLRSIPELMSAGSAALEIAKLTSFEDAPDNLSYPMLKELLFCLDCATTRTQTDLLISAYIFKILAHLGWMISLGECSECGDENPSYISCISGGVLCSSCIDGFKDALPITPMQIDWIAYLLNATFKDILTAKCDSQMSLWLVNLSHMWAATHLDTRLYATEFMLGF